jgi:PKD domain
MQTSLLQQVPTVTISTDLTTPLCLEGQKVRLTATAVTGIAAIDSQLDFYWTLPVSDVSLLEFDADGVSATYTCTNIGSNNRVELSVEPKATAPYPVQIVTAYAEFAIINADLTIDSVAVKRATAMLDTAVLTSVYVGETVDVAVAFTDPTTKSTYSATVDFGDGTVEEYNGKVKSFDVQHTYKTATAANTVYPITITVTDNVGSTEHSYHELTVSYKVRCESFVQANAYSSIDCFSSGTTTCTVIMYVRLLNTAVD